MATLDSLGDLRVYQAPPTHTADDGPRAFLQRYRRLVADRDVCPIVPRHHHVEVEPELVEHRPVVDDPLDRLVVAKRLGLPHLVADHRPAHQLVSEREIALVPYHQVVQLHHFTSDTRHASTHPTESISTL